MSNEVKRVPLDFAWPLHEVWEGFLRPDRFREIPCEACCYDREPTIMDELFPAPRSGTGYSPHAQHLHDLWYGHAPFDLATTGSVPLDAGTPAVRRFAERNVTASPEFYGTGESAIVREAHRLAVLRNNQWAHHLSQEDVDALVAADRLWDFTRKRTESGWEKIDPPVHPSAAAVNEWSLSGFGHDSLNAGIVIAARCAREGFPVYCAACDGYGSLEAYEGQRAEATAWKPAEPPMGAGWQLWESVTEGSPVSPVFATSAELAAWMSDPERGEDWVPAETAARFISHGWAPTGVFTPERGHMSGVEAAGVSGEDGPLGGDCT